MRVCPHSEHNSTPTVAGQVSTCTVATELAAPCFPYSYKRFPFSEQHFIRHFLSLLFLLRPHQQYQTEKEESKAAGAEILSTFTSSTRYHAETGNGETASASYLLGMVNYSSNCTRRMTPSSATCVQAAQHEAIPRTALCAGRAIPQRAVGPRAALLQILRVGPTLSCSGSSTGAFRAAPEPIWWKCQLLPASHSHRELLSLLSGHTLLPRDTLDSFIPFFLLSALWK